MSYVLVYQLIRVFEGKSIEITQSVLDSDNLNSNQSVQPLNGTKFQLGFNIHYYTESLTNWLFYNTHTELVQIDSIKHENGSYSQSYQNFPLELCNEANFSNKTFEDIPILKDMLWLPSNISLIGSRLSNVSRRLELRHSYKYEIITRLLMMYNPFRKEGISMKFVAIYEITKIRTS